MRSVVRTAPWSRAPLLFLTQPAVALAVGVTALVLGLTAAGGPLYLASVGSAAASLEVSQRCGPELGNVAAGAGPVRGIGPAGASLSAVTARSLAAAGAPRGALRSPIVTMVDGEAGSSGVGLSRSGKPGTARAAQLVTRTGGLSHIQVLTNAGGAGVWVSNDVASSLHIHAGDTVHLNLNDPEAAPSPTLKPVRVRVAGIYRQLVGTTLPEFWCSQTDIFGTPDSDFPPPPVVLVSPAMFVSILHSGHQRQVGSYLWEQAPSTNLTLPQAERVATALARFRSTIGVVPRNSTAQPRHIGGGFVAEANEPPQYGFVVSHAKAVQLAVRQGIVPGALAGVVIAALLVAAAGSYWADRRRTEIALLSSRGVSPAALGLKAALEMGVPVIVGAALGWVSGVGLVERIGPSAALGSNAEVEALWLVIGAAVVGMVLLGIVGGLRARGRIERPAGTRRSRWARVPFELAGMGLALWIWLTLGHVSLQAGATTAQPIQPGFLLFPLIFMVSCIALVGRLVVAGLRHRRVQHVTASSRVPLWLAVRSLTGAPQAAGLLIASLAAALGIFVYSAALTQSEQATVHAKAATFVGADVAATIDTIGRLPASLSAHATEVLSDPNDEVGRSPVDVIGVDPRTFGQGAFWDSSYSNRSLAGLMSDLASASHRHGAIPVIVAGGGDLSLRDGLRFSGYGTLSAPHALRLIDTAAEFPGQDGSTPVLVTTRSELDRFESAADVQVWSHGTQSAVLADLAGARIRVSIVEAAPSILDLTSFASVGWTFAYLQSLGILIGAVAVGGLLLFLTSRGRARALSYVLARRMGLSRRTHATSLAIELGATFGAGAVIGTVLAWTAVELVDSHLNPLPALPPVALLEVPWVALGAAALVAAAVWLLTTAWAQHVADRSRATELLRFDD